MPRGSLNKFTVPLATDQTAAHQGLLQPKQKYRFRIVFENFGVSTPRSEMTKAVVDFQRPSYSYEEVPLDIYNSKAYIQGKHTWETTTINLRDDINGEVSRLVGEQNQKQFDMLEQSAAAAASDFKFNMKCEITDGANGIFDANVLETWEMVGCMIQSTNYGDLAYASSDPVMIALTIRFDNALQTPLETTGIGINVGRAAGDLATG